MAGVNAYAERTGAAVIAEGIETAHDLATARSLGAVWSQGWLFGRPGPLTALSGREFERQAVIRPLRPAPRQPSTSLFPAATAARASRRVPRPMAAAFAEHLLQEATTAGQHGVILAADHDAEKFTAWLPRLVQVAPRVGFTAVLRPADGPEMPHGIRHATLAPDPAAAPEAAVVVIRPDAAIALCLRRLRSHEAHNDVGFVLTHDPATAATLARMILSQLGTRLAERPATAHL